MLGDFLLRSYNSFKNPWYHKLATRIISVNYGNCNSFWCSQGIHPQIRVNQIIPRMCRNVLHCKFCSARVPILLSSIGSTTYSLLSDLVAPTLPKDNLFAEIKAVVQKHFEPKHAVIAERFHFHKREQSAGESVAEYNAALRKLATHCKFGNHLEEALCDRFVCRLRNEGLQRRLLAETELLLTKAVEMALSMESTNKNTRSFKGQEPEIKRVHGKPLRTT